jgi:hypothetical protein
MSTPDLIINDFNVSSQETVGYQQYILPGIYVLRQTFYNFKLFISNYNVLYGTSSNTTQTRLASTSGQDVAVVDTGWQIAGVGDFNGDGKSDILWRNANGDTDIWDSNSAGGFTGIDLGIIASAWSIQRA